MKFIITASTGKSKKDSMEEELDEGCEIIEKTLYFLEKKFNNLRWSDVKIGANFTKVILEDSLTTKTK